LKQLKTECASELMHLSYSRIWYL